MEWFPMGLKKGPLRQMNETDRYLFTKKKCAEALSLSERSISRLINNGDLQKLAGTRKVLIPRREVEAFINEHTQYNGQCVGRAAQYPKGESEWPINAKTVGTIGGNTKTLAVESGLDDLLERRKRGKQMR
tara:strand:+ start:130 stop:522 length:393 start_codon:yes stop_codon:yes gene_type:complete